MESIKVSVKVKIRKHFYKDTTPVATEILYNILNHHLLFCSQKSRFMNYEIKKDGGLATRTA